ncbi:hypothetical protein GC163_04530 [bacterium]|nr:hypothetical protein [bacterium]
MNPEEPTALREWIDEPAVSRGKSPADYAPPVPWLGPSVAVGAFVVWLLLMGVARISLWGYLIASLMGALLGIMLTLVGMAWGVAIVFADNTRRGLWFTIFPPYMVIYAIQRWEWMRQPAVLFLCGLTLAFGSLYGANWMMSTPAAP